MNKKEFGKLFSYLCHQSSLSNASIAKSLDVDRATVGRWKKGEQTPNLSTLPKLAALLNVNMDVFSSDLADEIIDSFENDSSNNIDCIMNHLKKRCSDNKNLKEVLSNLCELNDNEINIIKDMSNALMTK